MPRVPYVYPSEGESPVADKIRERRKNGELIPLDGVLLNAPDIAAGYDSFIGAIRNMNSLDGALRELLILRVAALNGAAYEWMAHELVGRKDGLTTSQLREIRNVNGIGFGPDWKPPIEIGSRLANSSLTPLQLAAMGYTDASTRAVKVPEEVFERLKAEVKKSLVQQVNSGRLSKDELEGRINQQLVEIATTVGGYNLVSRILVGLNVEEMASDPVPNPDD